MTTKIIVIVGISVAAVVITFILGKLAEDKDGKSDNHSEQKD